MLMSLKDKNTNINQDGNLIFNNLKMGSGTLDALTDLIIYGL